MKTLSEKIAEHLKPLQAELAGYQFSYTAMSSCLVIEIVEQSSVHSSFTPISTKIFVNVGSCKTEVYVRVLQTTEIDLSRLNGIFTKVKEEVQKV